MPPKQTEPSPSTDPLTKTGPSARRQKQNREAQKRYREKRNRLYKDLERRYAELTNTSNSYTISTVGCEGGVCSDCVCYEDVKQHLAELQEENMSLTAMIHQSKLFEASTRTAVEQVHPNHQLTIPPAAELRMPHHSSDSQRLQDVVSEDIAWDELLNFSDSSDLDADEYTESTNNVQSMKQVVDNVKSDLNNVPSLKLCSDLVHQLADLVLSAEDLLIIKNHGGAVENVRKVMELKLLLVDKCMTQEDVNDTLRIVNPLLDKLVKLFFPDVPTTFYLFPGLETPEATKVIDDMLLYLLDSQSVSSHLPNLTQLKQKIMELVSSDALKAKALALLHVHGFPHNL